MYSTIKTAIIQGIQTKPIQVEVDISNGMPAFDMVGQLSGEVREGKERIRTALHNIGVILPAKRITINLSPANVRKNGTGFDLPIAIAILQSLGVISKEDCEGKLFIGELGLNGQILPVNGVLPIVSDGMQERIKDFVIPKDNEIEASLVKGANIYAFSNLQEIIDFLNGKPYVKEIYNIEELIEKPTCGTGRFLCFLFSYHGCMVMSPFGSLSQENISTSSLGEIPSDRSINPAIQASRPTISGAE